MTGGYIEFLFLRLIQAGGRDRSQRNPKPKIGAVVRQPFAGPRDAAETSEISFDPFVELQMLIIARPQFQPAEPRLVNYFVNKNPGLASG